MMKRIFIPVFVAISISIVLLSSSARAEQNQVPITRSTGTIFAVDSVGHYVMLQKADGKKVSLELTSETQVTLDGKRLSLDQLDVLEEGLPATAEHFTNDSGMQQTLKLTVQKGVTP